MGLVLSALGGAARGFEEAHDDQRKERMTIEGEQRRDASARGAALYSADLQDQRQRALLIFRQQQEDQARTDMAGRVAGAAGAIADKAVEEKRGVVRANMAAPEDWTPEQQAAVDQSLALDRQALMEDPDVRTQAAVSTGDIDPKTAAGLDIQGKKAQAAASAAERREALERDKLSSRERIEQDRMEQRDRIAERNADMQERRIGAMMERASRSGSGDPAKGALAYIEGRRKELADDASNTKALYAAAVKDVSSKRRAEVDAEFKPRLDEIDQKRRQVEEDFDALRERVGLPAKSKPAKPEPAAEPKASAPPSDGGAPKRITSPAEHARLPKGTRYIAPDGKTYIKN